MKFKRIKKGKSKGNRWEENNRQTKNIGCTIFLSIKVLHLWGNIHSLHKGCLLRSDKQRKEYGDQLPAWREDPPDRYWSHHQLFPTGRIGMIGEKICQINYFQKFFLAHWIVVI